jgi:S-adenosylmethionine:tRNA ribosyltransferase-isomerase
MARPSYPIARLDYELPPELVAQQPLAVRSSSRLLLVDAPSNSVSDHTFTELPSLLPAHTLLVLNNSKVIPARLWGTRPRNPLGQGGGRVEVLFHRWLGEGMCEAVVGSGASQPAGEQVELAEGWRCELLEPKALDGIRVRFMTGTSVAASLAELLAFLDRHGETPLPPYIKRPGDTAPEQAALDQRRYQTVFASQAGSVAAPTAGLHFDEAMLTALTEQGARRLEVTLHVGLGTFAPVRADDLRAHVMHSEPYSVDAATLAEYQRAQAAGEPILAVGTTSLRVLHTLRQPSSAAAGLTDAFIYPGHGTDACDLLLTNFHLPRSTLLALVYAFGGEDLLRRAYTHAVAERYRFFSYGDCMLIRR